MTEPIKTLFVIVDRGKADRIADRITACGAAYPHIVLGMGTAPNELTELLGIGSPEKDVLIASVPCARLPAVIACLKEEFRFDEAGKGIAFTVPLASVGGPASLQILLGSIGQGGK